VGTVVVRVWKVGGGGLVKSETEKIAPAASLVSIPLGLEQGWLAQCQFKVTGWGIMFICSMVPWCADTLKTRLESGPVTADLKTTVVHSSKLLINSYRDLSETDYILKNLNTNHQNLHKLYIPVTKYHFSYILSLMLK